MDQHQIHIKVLILILLELEGGGHGCAASHKKVYNMTEIKVSPPYQTGLNALLFVCICFLIDRYIPEFLITSFSSFTRCLLGNPFINGIIPFPACLSEFPKFPNIFALETKSRKITHFFRAALLYEEAKKVSVKILVWGIRDL